MRNLVKVRLLPFLGNIQLHSYHCLLWVKILHIYIYYFTISLSVLRTCKWTFLFKKKKA